jgi:hypothetical protein
MSALRNSGARSPRRLVMVRNACLAAFVVALILAVLPRTSQASPVPGSAGIAGALPSDPASEVAIRGRGRFSSMEFTVNQTKRLTNQAVSVSWTGGVPTKQGTQDIDSDFVQIMQCWGEDDGTNPDNPGPPPEQCVYGASDAVYGGRISTFGFGNYALTRVMATDGWPSFDRNREAGYYEAATGTVWRPFRAVDGTVVNDFVDSKFQPDVQGGQYWLNPYFSVVTTNEIPAARTLANGEGAALVEVATGVESSGLGCGQRVAVGGGALGTPKCWLVIVPRGTGEVENAGRPPGVPNVATSPLAVEVWENRIAVPLEFNPVDSPCAIDGDQRRLGGTEMALPAIVNWQPALCADAGSASFVFGISGDSIARQQLVTGSTGAPEMVAVSRPIAPDSVDPASPVVYAPLASSGLVIAFNFERDPPADRPPEALALKGTSVRDINLTPRLVAKLLSQSYRSQTQLGGPTPYAWAENNPLHLGLDPDFLRFNPEFEMLPAGGPRNFGGLSLPALNSDAARLVWEWILADPEARAWLDGEPDESGMRVNPAFATTAEANSSGTAFGDPVPENFPKADAYCYYGPDNTSSGVAVKAPQLCGADWLPYTQSLRESAQFTRAATDRAKIVKNAFAYATDNYYQREPPQVPGRRAFLGLTDTPSADQYGLQTAKLSRAGDDGDDREFVAADTAGLSQSVRAMTAGAEPAVLEPDPSAGDGAYPLTMLTYGAIRPLELDDAARADYARFVAYAAGDGQALGREPGDLRPGYAPLPDELRAQAVAAAGLILSLEAPPAEAQPPSASQSSSPGGRSPSGSSSPSGMSRASSATPMADIVDTVAIEEVVADTPKDAGPLTLALALARNRFFLVVLAGLAVVSSLGALEITKRPRRASTALSKEA